MSIFVIKNEKVSFFLTRVEKFCITRKWNIMLGKEWESVLTYISSLWVRKCRKIRSWFILNNVFCEKLSSGKLSSGKLSSGKMSEWEIVAWETVWWEKVRWEKVRWEIVAGKLSAGILHWECKRWHSILCIHWGTHSNIYIPVNWPT